MKRINRKFLAGIVGAALLVVTLGSISASAAVPYGCGAPGVACGVPYAGYVGYGGYAGYAGYAPGYAGYGAAGATYFDPRYCGDGLISVVPEPHNGAPIDICTSSGVRVYPVFADYAPYGGYGVPGVAPAGFAPYSYYVYR
jgi:hypothetical protein